MGIYWMIVRPKRREYLLLPKKGEWSNELWRIWELLKDTQHGEALQFYNDESKEYAEILNNMSWSNFGDNFKDMDSGDRLYNAEDIIGGGRYALYLALRRMEKEQKDAQASAQNVEVAP